MDLNEQIDRVARRATETELSAALETLQGHIRYRQELKEYGQRGGKAGPGGRPIWADPGRKRRGGHIS
jgi:hypothetical protein